jgi:hypothetical protein
VNLSLSLTDNLSLTGSGAPVPLSLSPLAWYDPSDLTTMFQTGSRAAPGTAVSADGDPVGLILDKSGNQLDLTQGTAANRPLYKTSGGLHWLQFDGSDDSLSINHASLRLLGDMTLCAAAYKNAGGSFGGILSCQTGAATVNAYEWRFSSAAGDLEPQFVSADGAAAEADAPSTAELLHTFATACVSSIRRDGGATVEFGLDGAREVEIHTTVPTADASSVFVMGNRSAGGIPLAGRIYQASVFGSYLSNGDLALLETHHGAKCGVVL